MSRPKIEDYVKDVIFCIECVDGSEEYIKNLDSERYMKDLEKYCDDLEKKIKILNKQLDIASYDVAFFSEKPDDRISFYKLYRKQIRKNPDEQYKILKDFLKKENEEL